MDGEPSGAWDEDSRFKHTPIGNRETPHKEGLGADDRSIQAAGTQVIAQWIARKTAPGLLMPIRTGDDTVLVQERNEVRSTPEASLMASRGSSTATGPT